MARLTLEIPDEIEARLRREAEQAGVSMSQYVLGKIAPVPAKAWPAGYFENVCGFLTEDFQEPDDPPPTPVEPIDVYR